MNDIEAIQKIIDDLEIDTIDDMLANSNCLSTKDYAKKMKIQS